MKTNGLCRIDVSTLKIHRLRDNSGQSGAFGPCPEVGEASTRADVAPTFRSAGRALAENADPKVGATKAAALHDVLETKGVSYEWRKPCRCLCH